MRFSQEFIEKVREATNLVDVISQHVQLKRSGTHRLVGLCPFHNEKSPSFSVSEEKQMYHCFGCKKAGNVYTFIQEFQGLSFPETVELLAQRASIPIPADTKRAGPSQDHYEQKKELQKQLYKINQFALTFFKQQAQSLTKDHKFHQYLQSRHLKQTAIEQFQLGYANDSWDDLALLMEKKGVPMHQAESLGLVRLRGNNREGYYNLQRDRLIFPIISQTGHVLGFGGRILDDAQQPKYLNSPESEVFHKGKIFYGLNETAKYIRLEDRVIVVEGYMDLIGLWQAGVMPVVATLGTALTTDHARVLKRLTKNVYVLFDGDSAGQEASERSLAILLAEGLVPRALTLPEELDPDDYVQKYGAEKLNQALNVAPELFLMVLEKSLKGYRASAAEKVQLLDRMAPFIKASADKRLKDLYAQELAERLQVEREWVYKGLQDGERREPNIVAEVSKKEASGDAMQKPEPKPLAQGIKVDMSETPKSELHLLNIALMKEKYFQIVMKFDLLEQINSTGVREIFARVQELYRQMPNKFDNLSASLVGEVSPPEVISMHLQPPFVDLTDEGAQKLIGDCVKKIQNDFLKAQSVHLRKNLRGIDPKDQLEKLEQIMNIHRSRQALKKE